MTPKELGELGHLEAAAPLVDPADLPPVEADAPLEPGHRKSVNLLREFAANPPDGSKPKTIVYDFFAKPVRVEGEGRAERLIVERTRLDDQTRAIGTGETYEIPGQPDRHQYRLFDPSDPGRALLRGPRPVLERPWPDRRSALLRRLGKAGAYRHHRHQPPRRLEVAKQIAAALPPGSNGGKSGGAGLNVLLKERGIRATSFTDWRKIEAAEEAAARAGSPRRRWSASRTGSERWATSGREWSGREDSNLRPLPPEDSALPG